MESTTTPDSDATPQGKVLAALDWAYAKALEGFAGVDSAQDMADEYLRTKGSAVDQANRLIRW